MYLWTKLLKCQLPNRGHDSVVVSVDRLTEMLHCAPTHTHVTAPKRAITIFDNVERLPDNIVSDRDPIFTSKFWKASFESTDVKLAKSTFHHPQPDG